MTISDPLHEALKRTQQEIAFLQEENNHLVKTNNSNVAVLNRLWDVAFKSGRDKDADSLSVGGRLDKIQTILRDHLRGVQNGIQGS